MSGKTNRRRNAIALSLSAAFHLIFLAFVINETATPYALPEVAPPPFEVEIVPPEEVPPPPVIPPKIKRALEKQAQQPPPPPLRPPTSTPPKPQAQPPAPVAPPKEAPPKPNPPTPAPPTQATPTPAKPAPPKPTTVPVAPAPARTPAPPSPAPSPTPAVKPAPTATVAPPNPISAKVTAPVIVLRPSQLNLHKPAKEVPSNVPTLPLSPGGSKEGGGGGGAPASGSGPLSGSRLNGLSPYPYGALPSGGPGLRGTLVGCANSEAVNLSSVERARCNERFGEEAAHAPVLDGIDPAKRARFDKTADRQERDRKAGMPVGTTAGAQGFGGLGPN